MTDTMEEVKITAESKMKKHVTIVGVIHIAFGVLGLIGAMTLFFAFHFARGFVSNEEVPAIVLTVLGLSLPLLVGFMSTLGLVGGIGLLAYRNWARYLIIIVAALGCLNIPIGTLKGVYSLWVLLQDETIQLFEKK
jgi:branched-subunit amino acid ABC-type transport system permease component